MRVGFDIRTALRGGAGIARYTRELAGALIESAGGPFLELYAYSRKVGRRDRLPWPAERCRLHRGLVPARVMHALHRLPGCDAGRFPAKVDVFHWTDYVYPPVRSAARVLTLHDAAFAVDPSFHGANTPVLLRRVRQALRHAHAVIVVSEPGRRDAELLGVDPRLVHVVPNGASAVFQSVCQETSQEREVDRAGYLLSVGTLEPRKNYPRLLQALERLWDQDLAPDWLLVGRPGWHYQDFVRQIESSRHRRRIRWLQSVTDLELARIYQGCIALLYPSLHEGFGLPVLEAMACAKPVVVSTGTAPAWVAGAGGTLVDPRESAAIAQGIEGLLQDPSRRRQATRLLQERARTFTWEKAAAQTLAAYRSAVEQFRG